MSTEPSTSIDIRQVTEVGDIVELTYDTLDYMAITNSVQDDGAGAIATFIGTTRDSFEGKVVTRLTYEAYSKLCIRTFASIAQRARSLASAENKHASDASPASTLKRIALHHRLGEVPVGQASIVIAVSSPHRREAFRACEWILEEVKREAQVWKREWYAGGAEGEGEAKRDGTDSAWKSNAPAPLT